MAKTYEQIDQARAEYALLTKEELQALSSADIRKAAASVAVGMVDNGDGTKVTYSRAKKSALVEAVWAVCEDKRQIVKAAEVAMVLTSEQLEAVEAMASEVDEVTRTNDGTLAKETWLGLRAYINALWIPVTQSWKATDGNLVNLERRLINKLTSTTDAKTTMLTRRGRILKMIGDLVAEETQNAHYQKYLDVFNEFKSGVYSALRDATLEKNQEYSTKLVARQNAVCSVKVQPLMDWASETLTTLSDEDDKSKWVNVAIALMLVTGRRQSEIMSSGRFSRASESTVMFSGQLKTKDRLDADDFEIPVHTSVAAVLNGMAWLEAKGKRQEDPKKAHNLYSRYLSEGCQRLNRKGLMEVTFVPEGSEPVKLKSHLCRQIYAQIALKGRPQGLKDKAYISKILGHSTQTLNTADCYNADIEIVD